MQIIQRPQNKELALGSSGLAQSVRPFVSFVLFGIGKFFITISMLLLNDMAAPGYVAKPINMYNMIGGIMLSPLGLHFFLAYQEFVFYSFCSYYRAFAKRVLESSDEKQTFSPTKSRIEQNQKAVAYVAPEHNLHGNLDELIDTMKNMTETFGPFLLQNFSLMLLYWLLHSYSLFYFVIQTFGTLGSSNPTVMALTYLEFAGSVLIIRWAQENKNLFLSQL